MKHALDGFITRAAQVNRLDDADRFAFVIVHGHPFTDPLRDTV
jgi:hypothetical protein